jgi:SAM-dependent MidA family methyltransferase
MALDWTSIADRAQSNGLRVAGFTDQHHFLTGIISEWPNLTSETGVKMKRELQTLLHPEMLGRAFHVLALSKNVDSAALKPAGFKFAREPRSVLRFSREHYVRITRSTCE